jgi:hypothetical protein
MNVPTFTSIDPPKGIMGGGLEKVINLITTSFDLLLVVAVVAAFIFLLIGGVKWIMSGGDKQALASARNTVTYALIGLALAFLSFMILGVFQYFFSFKLGVK